MPSGAPVPAGCRQEQSDDPGQQAHSTTDRFPHLPSAGEQGIDGIAVLPEVPCSLIGAPRPERGRTGPESHGQEKPEQKSRHPLPHVRVWAWCR